MNRVIAGLDEVGMGCIAGPVVVAVTAFNETDEPLHAYDSKSVSAKTREKTAREVVSKARYVGYGWTPAHIINKVGIRSAWNMAALQALGDEVFDELLVDGHLTIKGYNGKQTAIVKGDRDFWQISAASNVAKVMRDADICELATHYWGYDWEHNKGYGTRKHWAGLERFGYTPIHRMSFLRKWMEKNHIELQKRSTYRVKRF